MANPRGPFLLATAVAFLAAGLVTGEVEAGSLSGESGIGWAEAWSACDGTIGECLGREEAEEMAVDSESNRRILQDNEHVVYRSLRKDPLCGTPGAPNVACRESAVLNPSHFRHCKILQKCGGRGEGVPVLVTHLRD